MARKSRRKGKSVGPAALGHQPIASKFLKDNGLPAPRQDAVDAIDRSGAVDVPDKPVFPFLPSLD